LRRLLQKQREEAPWLLYSRALTVLFYSLKKSNCRARETSPAVPAPPRSAPRPPAPVPTCARGVLGMTTALIGGTGLATLPGLAIHSSHALETPYGRPSAPIEEGVLDASRLLFLHRHGGAGPPVPPHRVNYRANLWALRELGAKRILAVNAVGAIPADWTPGCLVLPDQLIDYTWGREHSFDDGSSGELLHVDFTEPYDNALREGLLAAAQRAGVPCKGRGVLGVVQGPRLETAAEVRRYARDGCDILGMTGMPEAALARELGLPYAAVCMVVNAAAGLASAPITLESMRDVLRAEVGLIGQLLREVLPTLDTQATPGLDGA
jgi:5'-methylthioinosine phosphorylase